MNDLIKLVSQKTGLNEAMSKIAVDMVVGFVKQKLPPQVVSQIDGFLVNPTTASGNVAQNIAQNLGNMFGGHKK